MTTRIPFDNSYARLAQGFFTRTNPTPVHDPRLIRFNRELAQQLGIDVAAILPDAAAIFSGNQIPDNAEPIAMAYAGHQFGSFVPQLGDGRAILLGEVIDRSGMRRDIQLKGSGRTPFSRGGDGRAAIGPVLREYIVSEAMHALGVPTTRALAAVTTGEPVYRETALPGAIFTRVASSHIRVGTFQYFAARGELDKVRSLADHVIERHYPDAAHAANRYRALLDGIVLAQARLVADWLLVGFIHGVMNTDNMSIAGETIDYGPCAFMDEYNPATVFSSIDRMGRYAYMQQPGIAQWNLARLAECLLPLISEDDDSAVAEATASVSALLPALQARYESGLVRKIGIQNEREGDAQLAHDLLLAMSENGADFTLTFRRLADVIENDETGIRALFMDQPALDRWLSRWRERLASDPLDPADRATAMRRMNPLFIPRNHRIEAVILAATQTHDLAPFEELLLVLSKPFENQPEFTHYSLPPEEHERVLKTFCGT